MYFTRWVIIAVWLVCCGSFESRNADAASFNCARARLPIERMICADALLSDLDDQLESAFRAAGGYSSPDLRSEEARWIVDQRNRCQNSACISTLYRRRIAELKNVDAHQPPQLDKSYVNPGLRTSQAPKPFAPRQPERPLAQQPNSRTESLSQPETLNEPLDRIVWQGDTKCGFTKSLIQLVVLGKIDTAKTAYFIVKQDYPSVLKYEVSYDKILDGLLLKNWQRVLSENSMVPLPQIDLSFQNNKSIVTGRLTPSCEFSLQRQSYPDDIVSNLEQIRKGRAFVPSVMMAETNDILPFCTSINAWMNDVRSGAAGRDLSKPIGDDIQSKLFLASIFHKKLAEKYLGFDLTSFDYLRRVDRDIHTKLYKFSNECSQHPLFIDQFKEIRNVFYKMFNGLQNNKELLSQIPTIESRANRIAAASDRFTEDLASFAALTAYLTPLQKELEPVLSQVRDAVLKPLNQRQIGIAAAALKKEADARVEEPRSVQSMGQIDDAVTLLKTSDSSANNGVGTAISRGEDILSTEIKNMMKADIRSLGDLKTDVYGLSHFRQGQDSIGKKLVRFSSYPAYRATMADIDTQILKMQKIVEGDIEKIVRQASDIKEIMNVRSAIESYESATKKQVNSPLWTAYTQGLNGWFEAKLQANPAADSSQSYDVLNPSGASASSDAPISQLTGEKSEIFSVTKLQNRSIISAIYRHKFGSLQKNQEDATSVLFSMLTVIGNTCPGSVSNETFRRLAEMRFGPGIFGSAQDVQNVGAEIIKDQFLAVGKYIQDPGRANYNMVRSANVEARAQGDAQLILSVVQCRDDEMIAFLKNVEDFFRDPGMGVSNDEIGFAGLCKRGFTINDRAAGLYCDCAASVFERRLNTVQMKFIRSNPRENVRTVINLIPDRDGNLNKCRQ